jgi:hypothetical protein
MSREPFSPYYEPWTVDAACRTTGDAFYPDELAAHEDWDYLRSLCLTRCPVLTSCRDWVMRIELGHDYRTRFGVAAGMSPLERKKFEPEWLAGQQGAA